MCLLTEVPMTCVNLRRTAVGDYLSFLLLTYSRQSAIVTILGQVANPLHCFFSFPFFDLVFFSHHFSQPTATVFCRRKRSFPEASNLNTLCFLPSLHLWLFWAIYTVTQGFLLLWIEGARLPNASYVGEYTHPFINQGRVTRILWVIKQFIFRAGQWQKVLFMTCNNCFNNRWKCIKTVNSSH